MILYYREQLCLPLVAMRENIYLAPIGFFLLIFYLREDKSVYEKVEMRLNAVTKLIFYILSKRKALLYTFL